MLSIFETQLKSKIYIHYNHNMASGILSLDFSQNPNHLFIRMEHMLENMFNDYITSCETYRKILMVNNKSTSVIENRVAALLAAYASGLKPAVGASAPGVAASASEGLADMFPVDEHGNPSTELTELEKHMMNQRRQLERELQPTVDSNAPGFTVRDKSAADKPVAPANQRAAPRASNVTDDTSDLADIASAALSQTTTQTTTEVADVFDTMPIGDLTQKALGDLLDGPGIKPPKLSGDPLGAPINVFMRMKPREQKKVQRELYNKAKNYVETMARSNESIRNLSPDEYNALIFKTADSYLSDYIASH
jgi:hypothetical protein